MHICFIVLHSHSHTYSYTTIAVCLWSLEPMRLVFCSIHENHTHHKPKGNHDDRVKICVRETRHLADLSMFFIVVIVVAAAAASFLSIVYVWRQYWQFESLFFLSICKMHISWWFKMQASHSQTVILLLRSPFQCCELIVEFQMPGCNGADDRKSRQASK